LAMPIMSLPAGSLMALWSSLLTFLLPMISLLRCLFNNVYMA
jgi:hypothetical protein